MSKHQVLSFFTGGGGLDLGLEQAGLTVAVGQELDRHACDTLMANGRQVVQGDIRNLLQSDAHLTSMREHLDAAEELFAIVGGPPCQSFSTAGKRGGLVDARGMLIFDYLSIIPILNPRFVILENVKGLLSTKGKNGPVLDDVLAEFHKYGYQTKHGVLDAVNYGAAQFRERLVIIGSRDNEPIFLPNPTNFQQHQKSDYRWRTLGDAIGDIANHPHDYVPFSARAAEVLNLVPEGGNWRSLPPAIAQQAMGGAWESEGGKVGFFRRLRFCEPAPTLVTSPIQKATMLAHPHLPRPLSVQEYARIQGFPDGWQFSGNLTEKYRQIGNAVPIALGAALGEMLLATVAGDSSIVTKRRRGTSTHTIAEQALGMAA